METNFMDDRREALGVANGKPDFQVARRKAEACNRALAEAANFMWLYGDPVLGVDGFHNHPAVPTISITTPWSAATAQQILADLEAMLWTIPNTSQGQLGDVRRIRIELPPDQYQIANSMIISSAGDKSVLRYFKDNHGLRDEQVVQVFSFAAANSQIYTGGPQGLANDRGAIVYEKGDGWDPKFMLPQDIEMPAPPRQNGLSETTFYHMRAGGMMLADARRMRYVEGF
jgi:hypothetical protein